jgi:hypothetical protein
MMHRNIEEETAIEGVLWRRNRAILSRQGRLFASAQCGAARRRIKTVYLSIAVDALQIPGAE